MSLSRNSNPRASVTIEQHKFNTRVQQRGETIQSHVSDLKNKASSCEFEDLKDEMIKDRLVCGIENDKLRVTLLREHKLKSLNICNKTDYTKKVKLISNSGNTTGQIHLCCRYNGNIHDLLFQVINQSFEPLIGVQSSLDLNIVTINNANSVLQASTLGIHNLHDTHTVISKGAYWSMLQGYFWHRSR